MRHPDDSCPAANSFTTPTMQLALPQEKTGDPLCVHGYKAERQEKCRGCVPPMNARRVLPIYK
jgi:hypothetical protein